MPIRAVIFDLDGVIVATDRFHFLAWKCMADQEGISFDENDNEHLRGVSRRESLEIILEKATRMYSAAEKEALLGMKNESYRQSLGGLSEKDILPGVLDNIRELRANSVRIAIGSSSRNAQRILDRLSLQELLDAVADGNDIERSKPAPEVFLLAARRLGEDPANCLVVEDAVAGVEAALAAKMKCLAVGSARWHKGAHFQAKDLSEVNIAALCFSRWS